jgi:single-strand DNA-binding protein
MNKVLLIGRLTKDAELRYTANGKAVASFTVAVQRNKEEADFINCVAWNKTAENLANYTSKGSLIGVEGSIQTRNYEKDGKRVYITEIWAQNVEFLGSKGKSTPNENKANTGQNLKPDVDFDPFANEGTQINLSDDDLPF